MTSPSCRENDLISENTFDKGQSTHLKTIAPLKQAGNVLTNPIAGMELNTGDPQLRAKQSIVTPFRFSP